MSEKFNKFLKNALYQTWVNPLAAKAVDSHRSSSGRGQFLLETSWKKA